MTLVRSNSIIIGKWLTMPLFRPKKLVLALATSTLVAKTRKKAKDEAKNKTKNEVVILKKYYALIIFFIFKKPPQLLRF